MTRVAAVLLYIAGTLVVLTSIWLSNQRRTNIISKPDDNLSSDYEVELKVRVALQAKNRFWTQKSNVFSAAKPEIEESYRWASQVFNHGLKKFDTPFLYGAYGTFLFGKCNFNYALTVFSKARRLSSIDFDVSFQLFKMSRLIEHIFSQQKGTFEVLAYFKFLDLSRQTELSQNKFLAKKLALLTELKKPNASPKRLQVIGFAFQQLLAEIQQNYQQMFALNHSAKVLRRYASFVSNILGSAQMTKSIVELADHLREDDATDSKHTKSVGLETQAALFDERNAVFVISGEENNLGEIFEVNLGAVDMFGFTVSSELVGANISSMMPTPFSGTCRIPPSSTMIHSLQKCIVASSGSI